MLKKDRLRVCQAISRESMSISRHIPSAFPGYPGIFYYLDFNGPIDWVRARRLRIGPGRINYSPRRKRRDARQDRQPIRPRIRGISRWHQKSEYETRRKLHDVIIVLWECLEWSEYHNTGVAHSLWELLLQILQFYYCGSSCPVVNSHVAFTRVPAKPNFFACVPFCHVSIAPVSSTRRSASAPSAPSLSVHFLRRSYEACDFSGF